MGEIRLCITSQSLDYCAVVIAEMQNTPDAMIELAGLTVYRADQSRGGGVCIYINIIWCTNSSVIDTHCSLNVEYLMLDYRPFYLQREFTSVTTITVYVLLQVNARTAIEGLKDTISCHLSAHLDSFVIAAGDFNYTNLHSVMPKFPHMRRIHSIKCTSISQMLTKLHCRTLDFLIMYTCFSYLHTNLWFAGRNQH